MQAPGDFRLYVILAIAATARLLMQMAAMPPYAGLDEVYHVARLAFVRAEGRNPTIVEASVPPYLVRSIAADAKAAPAFCVVGPRWPEIVRARRIVIDQPIDSRPYVTSNYEAQQPSLYYSIVAPLVPARSAMFELRAWRLMSVFFALIVVVGTAMIAGRTVGFIAAALIVSLPTWETLVVRASNDAFACAMVTVAIAATVFRKPIAETVAWALAVAAKLYTWPMLIMLPLLWRQQRANRARVIAVAVACATAAALTVVDLSHRTRNPLGLFAFDAAAARPTAIRVAEMLKIWIATLTWTSGQHWDALRPLGIALYALPIMIVLVARSRGSAVSWFAIAAFTLAQIINAAAYARTAQGGLPAGGKEGWYWYALVPILIPSMLVPALARFRPLAWWIVTWDVLITEVALFHDYSGASTPAHPTALFRWGPWHWPFIAHLDGIGVGPFVGAIVILRIAHLAAFFALESLTRDRSDDLPLSHS